MMWLPSATVILTLSFTLAYPVISAPPTFQPVMNIKHADSNKCIDVRGGERKGNKLQIWDCNGGENQKFAWWEISPHQIHLAAVSGECTDGVQGKCCVDDLGSLGKGSQLGVWDCHIITATSNSGGNQDWGCDNQGDPCDKESGVIKNWSMGPPVGQLCFDIPGGDLTNGNIVWLWDCNGSPNQQWIFEPVEKSFSRDIVVV